MAILVIILLIVPSYFAWTLIKAAVFRVTGADNRPVLVAALFMALMFTLSASSLVIGLVFYGDLTHNFPPWLGWSFMYFTVAGGLVLIGLALKGIATVCEGVVDAIRGK